MGVTLNRSFLGKAKALNIRAFVTCRPETTISTGFSGLGHRLVTSSSRLRTCTTRRRSYLGRHGAREIAPPPPKKSCLDRARNAVARVATQPRADHWRSAVFFQENSKAPGVGRIVEDGVGRGEKGRPAGWIAWEAEERVAQDL